MSDLLSIGASGVRAYQTALSTVGENIANSGVTGYSRRSVALTEIAGVSGTVAIKADAGSGVAVGSIARSTDTYATAALRSASADLARTTTASTWLTQIQSALTGNNLTSRITAFYSSASSLSADPSSTSLRANMLGTATSTAAAFTATGNAFDQIQTDLDTSGGEAAQTLTSLGASLVRINDGLGRTQPGTSAAAQLADQRDSVLGQMSALASVDAKADSLGRVTVKLGGANGTPFVSNTQSGAVGYARAADGSVGFTVSYAGANTPLATEGGAMAGIVDGAQKIAAARTALNTIASGFTTSVNTVQAQGDDLNGTAGQPIFATGADATDITVAMTDGRGIAAATRGAGVRNAGNLDALQGARMTGGFESNTTDLITNTATAITQKATISDAQTAIRDGAATALANSTGTSLDSEAVDLMRFQQAYSASSRVIQVARDTFSTILEIK
ncbi:flagellar hook-associated protein FlgK [Sphingomonas sp. CROZ-RG-20F-R02-07]|uniref:flagellar hook-associated protein FlgK n=1 Tax=Sphingomonas sp. CROZ-RG-20F-R02-07 TaxID=2914832 RepID=UPI001F582E3E|nr:flagellar hook-associated protein FlgK [Sphingomonas sp. CROZ-RG-20F-R02-07]